jgi:hypothetical protein
VFSKHLLQDLHSNKQMLTFHSPNPAEPLIAGYGLGR